MTFSKDSKRIRRQPFEELKEKKKKEEPLPQPMEPSKVAKEHMEKPKEIHIEKQLLAEALEQSQA